MPAQHFVPSFANAIHASSRAQANALRALALAGEETVENEWKPRAAAALLLGSEWAGEERTRAELAKAAGVNEKAVAQHYQALADRLRAFR
jgi:transcription initiation factor TFIIIB Brf1 subunit/transcription initiation factor TFIIB